MNGKYNWAFIGAGGIANDMAAIFKEHGRSVYGIFNRTFSKAEAFAEKYGIEHLYKNSEELFEDGNVDIVYIATTHDTHYGFAKKCLLSGKHVLVEKAITLNSRELDELCELASDKGLILAEAQTIYHMPLYRELWRMKDSGELGKVQIITANFGSFKEYDPSNRFFNPELAGGALLDIGVYALAAVMSFMDSCPVDVHSFMKPSPTGSDESSAVILRTESGQLAAVALSMHSRQPKRIMISFEKGYLEISDYPRGDRALFTDAETKDTWEITSGSKKDALYYEIQDMEEAVRTGGNDLMKLEHTQSVMEIMTRLRKEWGLKYPAEEHE